ncbi:MAG: hypothetical protein V7741_07710 [Hyphomonas sp.]
MSNRLAITFLIYGMIQAVLFGAGAVAVLATPLKDQAAILLPLVVVVSAGLAIPFAWKIAPRMRAAHQRRMARRNDLNHA